MANRKTEEEVQQMCIDAKRLGFRPERLMLLDKRLTEWSENEMTPSIAVKILRHGETAFEGAYGILGPGHEPDSLATDSIFPVCSITKPVVGVLLSIMQEEGLLDLNHAVRDYIPEFTGDKNGSVRIWHLLTHTSGLIDEDLYRNFDRFVTNDLGLVIPGDDAGKDAWSEFYLKVREKMGLPYMEPGRRMTRDTFLAVCYRFPPTYKPQKVMSYCNTGYNIAVSIITRISGMRIDEYAGQKLFGPLKMVDSHFLFPKEKLSRYVTRGPGYVGHGWLNDSVLESEDGSGGLKSTVHDMTRFGQMMLNRGRLDGEIILSPASVREMMRDHNQKVPPAVYEGEIYDSTWGLGWNLRGSKKDDCGMLRSPESVDHSGFGCSKLLVDPAYDITAAYFTVCKTDTYWKAANFMNMAIAAIGDIDI